jgi:surface antigen
MTIRTSVAESAALATSTTDLRHQVLKKHTETRKKASVISVGKITAYVGAFLLLVTVVAVGYESPRPASGQVASVTQEDESAASLTDSDTPPSVDEVVATGVAADLAERTNLPIAKNVANLSVSLTAKSELAQTDTATITKPQIIQPSESARTIITHVVKRGETVSSLAKHYSISADTIRWANNIDQQTDALEPGRKLTILPITGVLYTVKHGDTVQSIARTYTSDADRIVLFNDLELSSLKPGRKIIVPSGEKPAAPDTTVSSFAGQSGSIAGNAFVGLSAGNRYAPGNCTWYAYERRQQLGKPVGSFWGNANTWASNARAAGYRVDSTPAVSAVLVDQAGFFGHVAVVEKVKSNGDIVVSEMNNYAYGGFNIVNYRTISAGQAAAYLYIH